MCKYLKLGTKMVAAFGLMRYMVLKDTMEGLDP